MDNKFFAFIEKYRDDIVAFFKSFVDMIKAIFENVGGDETTAA